MNSDLLKVVTPTDENVAALATEIERQFGYSVGTGWRARQALMALSTILARRAARASFPVESVSEAVR